MPTPSAIRSFLKRDAARAYLHALVALFAVFVLYRGLRVGIEGIAKADYERFSFLASSALRSLADWQFYVFLVAAAGIFWRNRSCRGWKDITGETRFHWVIWTVIGILVWSAALYPFNFLYGEAHLLDRGLLIAAGALSIRYPAALPILTFCVMSSFAQWRLPLGDPEITNRKILLDLLFTLNAILLLRGWKWINPAIAVIALMSVNLIHYWIPGLAKFDAGNTAMEWLLEDRPSNMMVAGYFVGWNHLWDEETMVSIYKFLAPLEIPLKIFVLIVELALLASFLNRRIMVALSLGRLAMHVGIWILSGDTFYNWIILQIAVTIAFWRAPDSKPSRLYGWVPASLGAIYVLLTSHSHQASPLGWMDSRLFERYDVYAITVDNERAQVPPGFFEPYSFIFAQTKFHFLLEENPKTLTRTYGAIHDPRIAKRVRETNSPEEVLRIIDEEGTIEVSAKKKQGLRSFLKRWFRNHHEHAGALSDTLEFLAPPPHAYAYARRDADAVYDGKTKVKRVVIVLRTVFFDGENYHELANRPVYEFSVK